jgi:hypothetical protein
MAAEPRHLDAARRTRPTGRPQSTGPAPYQTPTLLVYGTLAGLTSATGSKSKLDGGTKVGMRRSQ